LSLFSKGIKIILSAENIIYVDGIMVNTSSTKEGIIDEGSTGMAERTTDSTGETYGNDQSSTSMAEETIASTGETYGNDQSSTGMAEGAIASTRETVGVDQSSTGMAEGTIVSTGETVGNDQKSTGMAEGTATTKTESTLLRTSSTSISNAIRLNTSSSKFYFSLINYHFDKPNSYSPSDDANSYGL